jgi:hypothetical protein
VTEPDSPTPELTARQEKAVLALLAAGSAPAAAQVVGVSARTVQRWLRQEHFARAVKEAKREMMEAGRRRLCGSVLEAAATMCRLLHSEDERTRLRAAVEIWKRLDADGLAEVEKRLDELEAGPSRNGRARPYQDV